MVICSFHRGTRAFFATAVLMGAFLLTFPFTALAQQGKPQSEQGMTKQQRSVSPEQVEKHIARLHDQLEVTASQEAVWKDVAQVMRDNSKRMSALIDKWAQGKGRRTVVENLMAQKDISEEYSQSLSRLIPVMEKLYASMSPEQKKGADLVFDREKGREGRRGKRSQ